MSKAAVGTTLSELDLLQEARLDPIWKRLNESRDVSVDDIFLSERVAASISESKAYLPSFDLQRILTLLPFWKNIYVSVCPACAWESSKSFNLLVQSGAITPVLLAPYRFYDEEFRRFVSTHDHVSSHEFALYRTMALTHDRERVVCRHCVGQRRREIIRLAKRSKKLADSAHEVDLILRNLHPHIYPDYELIDHLYAATKRDSAIRFNELSNLSWTINNVRSMQALNAPILLAESELSSLPDGLTAESDEARRVGANLQDQAFQGLGLTIPMDVPIAQYVEIARQFQPQIQTIAKTLLNADKLSKHGDARTALLKQIMRLNAEVERVKGLKRYAFLEAAVDFFGNNRALAMTTLMAGTLGVAGGIVGCASGVAISGGSYVAKKKGWIAPSEGVRRLGSLVRRDLQPYLNKLIAMYVGSDVPSVTLLSMRQRAAKRKAA